MMKETEIKDLYKELENSVICKNLKKAFEILATLLHSLRKSDWTDKKDSLEQNYLYLLHYAIDGFNDPMQEDIYNKIRLSTLALADKAYNALMTSISNDYPYVQKRAISKVPFAKNDDIERILIQKTDCEDRDHMLSLVFSRLWLKAFYTEREINLVESLIFGNESTDDDRCIIVSALMLSLLLQYDDKKLDLIITICNSTNGAIQDRAFIALLLCCDKYFCRLKLNLLLTNKINKLTLKPWFKEKFVCVMCCFINGLETEKINKELSDDIMPKIMKESAIIQKDIDLNCLINSYNNFKEDPEWKKQIDNFDFSDQLKRFSDLQKNGADVFMGTFSSMKNHVFFSQICNWFRPYNTTNYWIKKEFNGKSYQLFDFISLNPSICDSDRYSMLFSLTSIPDDYIKELEKGLGAQIKDIKDFNTNIQAKDNSFNNISHIQLYWQDLYRFFKLHPYKKSFEDPFCKGINIINLPFIENIDNKTLLSIAEVLMNKKFYSLALPILLLIADKQENTDAVTLQRIGFCYQKKMMYAEALCYYEKAEIVGAISSWLYKVKAYCYTQTNDYKAALSHYQHIINKREDLGIILCQAKCLIALKQYSDALPLLFKLDYQAPSDKISRLISWCAFENHNFEQATHYLYKIDTDKRDSRDWILLGHINWCNNNKKEAITFYKTALKTNNNKAELIESIRNDIDILIKNGIHKNEICLVFDTIRYIETTV